MLARSSSCKLIGCTLPQGDSYELLTTLAADGVSIDSVEKLPEGTQPSLTIEELCLAEEKCRADPRVVKVAAEVNCPPEQ